MNVEETRQKLDEKLGIKRIKLEIKEAERKMKLVDNASKVELFLANERLPLGGIKRRLSPFLDLLDARYMPLACAAIPQAHAVYTWLYHSYIPSQRTLDTLIISIIGGLGFELIYVGAIAWSAPSRTLVDERGQKSKQSFWYLVTAIIALVFSTAVAFYSFSNLASFPNGNWLVENVGAFLHIGFPLVAFAYTMYIHNAVNPPVKQEQLQPLFSQIDLEASQDQKLETLNAQIQQDRQTLVDWLQEHFQTISERNEQSLQNAMAAIANRIDSVEDRIVPAPAQVQSLPYQEPENNRQYNALPQQQAQTSNTDVSVKQLVETGQLAVSDAVSQYGVNRQTAQSWLSRARAKQQQSN